jgi:hypothetical protein
MSSCLRAFLFSALFLLFASASPAITINASDSGNYSASGNHALGDLEYVAGWDNEGLHDYFVFDLSSLSGTIASATLHVYNPAVCEPDCSYTGGYDSPDATETYNLHEVLLPRGARHQLGAEPADLHRPRRRRLVRQPQREHRRQRRVHRHPVERGRDRSRTELGRDRQLRARR